MLKMEAYMQAAVAAQEGYFSVVKCRGESCCLQAQMTGEAALRSFWRTLKDSLEIGESLRVFSPPPGGARQISYHKFYRREE